MIIMQEWYLTDNLLPKRDCYVEGSNDGINVSNTFFYSERARKKGGGETNFFAFFRDQKGTPVSCLPADAPKYWRTLID